MAIHLNANKNAIRKIILCPKHIPTIGQGTYSIAAMHLYYNSKQSAKLPFLQMLLKVLRPLQSCFIQVLVTSKVEEGIDPHIFSRTLELHIGKSNNWGKQMNMV